MDFHSLVADPTTPDRLFVGGNQAVSESTDGGRTWTRIDNHDDADAMGLAFTDRGLCVSGHPRINLAGDGADTFERLNDGLPDTDIHTFGAAGDGRRFAAGPSVGVITSNDGAASWETLTDRAEQGFFGRILVDATDPDHLIAADGGVGPVESRDGGRSWRADDRFDHVPADRQRGEPQPAATERAITTTSDRLLTQSARVAARSCWPMRRTRTRRYALGACSPTRWCRGPN